MKLLSKSLLMLCLLCGSFSLYGIEKEDSLSTEVSLQGLYGSEGFAPFWLTRNQYGKYNDLENEAIINPAAFYGLRLGKHFKINAGIDILGSTSGNSHLNQGFVNVEYRSLKVIMGKQHYTIGQYGDDLAAGTFLVSSNAQPIPRVGIGFYDYVNVPFTKGYLQIKGALNHGWMEKDRLHHSAFNSPLLHEKYLYFKTNKFPIDLYAGLAHHAMYGGVDKNGAKVGIDYWSVLFGKGSTAAGLKGEATNAIGEHTGIVDIGLMKTIANYDITIYYQKPINDSGGFQDNFARNNDFFLGLSLVTDEKRRISGLSLEFFRTADQLGIGVPDVIINNELIIISDPNDREKLREYYGNLGYPVEDLHTFIQWQDFMEAYYNYGYTFGGRTDYYNNSYYRHVYKDKVMGLPYILSKPITEKWTNQSQPGPYFVSNRVSGFHLALKGWITERLRYKTKIAYTMNTGAWQEYGGRFEWTGGWNGVDGIDPNYEWFWKGEPKQVYSMLELEYFLKKYNGLSLNLNVGADFGELTKNTGINLGVKYAYGTRVLKTN